MSNLQKVNKFQNEGGSDVYCEDYDLANKGTKSTVASDDYVVLEDVNGDYQKIAKASFVDAVRDALGTVLNNLDKGSSAITRVPAIAGSDLGSATLANLASALGVAALISQLDNWTISSKDIYWDTTITKNLSPTSYPVGLSFGLIYNGIANGYPENQGTAITCISSTRAEYCYGGQICIFCNSIIVRFISGGVWASFKKIDLVDA